jgi:hypothetical protein
MSVWYETPGGATNGLTRLSTPQAVPGRSGSWNADIYGRLTREFLFITWPQQKELGPEVIPVHRLVSVQFGDGGIKQVTTNQPLPEQKTAPETKSPDAGKPGPAR